MANRVPKSVRPSLSVASEVVRHIRQHARSNMKTEVCGVLIGDRRGNTIDIQSAIQGVNAAQAGTHVTFTQDTWEHVYRIKDEQYPNKRIVGWYHSHPGFGIFLSDHDVFIHKNFFSSPDQVAWVYDPHSDEEGCFGWAGDRLERIGQFQTVDARGGELVELDPRPEPMVTGIDETEDQEFLTTEPFGEKGPRDQREPAWMRWTSIVLSHLTVLLIGLLIAWYVFPRIVPIPVDPVTGRPLLEILEPRRSAQPSAVQQPAPTDSAPNNNSNQQPVTQKDDNGQRHQ